MNTIKSFLIALSLVTAAQNLLGQPAVEPANAISPPVPAAARPVPAPEPADVYSAQPGGAHFATTVTTNDLVTLAHTNGAKLILHFTRIEGTNIAYRWRSQSSPEAPVVTGESRLSEPYQGPSPPATTNSKVVAKGEPLPLHVFNAGGMRIVWRLPEATLDRWASTRQNLRGSGRAEDRGQDAAAISIYTSAELVSMRRYSGVEQFDALLDTVPLKSYEPLPQYRTPGGTPIARGRPATLTPPARPVTLKPGDAAPKLDCGEWVQGEPVVTLESGNAFLIEFWATWCGPCREAIPHLNDLHRKYREQGLIVIGQNGLERDEMQVKPFLAKMGNQMTYRVALDKSGRGRGTMVETWMTPAGHSGIPVAFLVDRTQRIAWIGHPMELPDALVEQVLAGTYDVKKAAKETALREVRPRTPAQSENR